MAALRRVLGQKCLPFSSCLWVTATKFGLSSRLMGTKRVCVRADSGSRVGEISVCHRRASFDAWPSSLNGFDGCPWSEDVPAHCIERGSVPGARSWSCVAWHASLKRSLGPWGAGAVPPIWASNVGLYKCDGSSVCHPCPFPNSHHSSLLGVVC